MSSESPKIMARFPNMILTELYSPTAPCCDHSRAPLFENMENFRQRLVAPFYCPGHKGGRSLPAELNGSLGIYDLNNLPDTDTLHCPTGPIREAQELVADAYGVDRSFLMVGGSSLGYRVKSLRHTRREFQ